MTIVLPIRVYVAQKLLFSLFWRENQPLRGKNNKSDSLLVLTYYFCIHSHKKNHVIWLYFMNYSQKRQNIAILHLIFAKISFLDIHFSYFHQSLEILFLHPENSSFLSGCRRKDHL